MGHMGTPSCGLIGNYAMLLKQYATAYPHLFHY